MSRAEYLAEVRAEHRAQPHWTYVVRSADGTVLYIGCTRNPRGRMATHRSKAAGRWWPDAARIDWQRFPDYVTARVAERELICTLTPLHNVQRMQSGRSIIGVAS